MTRPFCKATIWTEYTQRGCSRFAVTEDGYCKQHSADARKARRDASLRRMQERAKRAAARAVEQAIHLLRSRGYTVTPPGEQ
jgi:hypothetical protein